MIKDLYFPFNAEELENDEFDRVWDAEDFAKYFALFVGDGVYPNPSNNLKVVANLNFTVTVMRGNGFIKGHGYILYQLHDIRLNPADSTNKRIDAVFLQLHNKDRLIRIVYRAGIPASNPKAPEIIRNDDIWELKLAEVTIAPNVNNIFPADILDTRIDPSVCGMVSCVVDSVDTTNLFEQYDNYLKLKQNQWEQIQDQEENNWKNQLNSQKTDYNNFKKEMEDWLDLIKIDLPKYAGFDFDNLSAHIGTQADIEFLSNGNINEVLKVKSTNVKVAERLTEFLSNGTIKCTEIVYQSDGKTILRKSIKTTTFGSNKITEVIS